MLLGFFLFLFSLGQVTCSVPNVGCTIINLEYIDCIWNENGIPEFNYTFYSSLINKSHCGACPTYLKKGDHTVGCRLPYNKSDKFKKLYLSLDNCSPETVREINLIDRVKLRPPHNLSVHMQSSTELRLYWNISAPLKQNCVESDVSYRKDADQEKSSGVLRGNYFSLHFPSANNLYTFQVRNRVKDACHQSNWSAWSTPVYWGQIKQSNSTSTEGNDGGNSMHGMVFTLAVVCCVVVVAVFVFMIQHERLRFILIPIVPKPSKTLEELLYTYNGNVEEWLHISKDFVEGFKPNFSEPACPVREYNLVPQMSLSGSEDSLPVLLDESDFLDRSCSTSTSTISSPPGNTPPGLV